MAIGAGLPRRAQQALATREDIVSSAGRLMLGRGYVAVSIGDIATDANVAVQTIYNSVGTKAEVLAAILERVAEQADAPDLVSASMRHKIEEARNPSEIIRILAAWCQVVNERTAGILRVVTEAAVIDPDVAEFARRQDVTRLRGYGEVATVLRVRRGLRTGLSDHEGAAAIWAIGHPQVYRTLVLEVGWSVESYREWLEKTFHGALV
ncbi:TetR/AcrR family transcriptional regulator [Cryobacterium psychrophilum]|uniref:TetR/AcrR family transcriptional regulator n=1 Tax=Cryobacterium psychrophilum TaxID=41988 RepID=A0A4Y8KRR0_9MICO|nr:TetR/AcrR family transcriptional regulator [Cryobacterium psychrophilum]TDW28555.1 TetR family transcriptional regulator [Cryobacterium psychrophilum]TFD80446.1 TetR/AcrR family transcriptional regulator [Cryobacterium psychrophilum]